MKNIKQQIGHQTTRYCRYENKTVAKSKKSHNPISQLLPDRAVQKGCGLITDQTTCDHREKRGTCACNDRNLCNGATNANMAGKIVFTIALAALAIHSRGQIGS